jgi:VWFA-related protein
MRNEPVGLRRALSFACLVVLAAAAPVGQTSQQTPTFRAEGRVIEVDAHVTDAKGVFVRGLTREDFEIFEDDQAQEISAFTMVDVPVESAPEGRDKPSVPVVDPDVTTNATDGRIYVMLLDSPGTAVGATAYVQRETMFVFTQRVARRFVDEALGPNDLMAVIHVQDARSDAQTFTSNKSLLRASIDRLKPDMGDAMACDPGRIRNSYEMIQAVSERLGDLTGRRKAILWVNGRVPFDPADPSECGLPAAAAGSLTFMYRDAMRAATRNNVAIYPIDSVGLTADPTGRGASSGRQLKGYAALRGIADDTGGEAIVNTNNFSPGFERIVRRHSAYYLLGYRPTQDHRDGKFHPITVRVHQSGLSVRARKGYYAPQLSVPLEAGPLRDVSAAAAEALARSLPSRGLELQMFLAPFKGAGKDASVLVGAEVRGLARVNAAEPRVEISYLVIDAQGKTRVTPPAFVSLPLADRNDADNAALRYVDRLVLPRGRHELRMAVHQPGGNTGSIVAHVEIPDFTKSPLAMSGVVLLASKASLGPLLLGDPLLNGTPVARSTTRRRFTHGEAVTALVEVYSEARTQPEGFGMKMTITSATAPGAKVTSEPPTPTAAEPGRITYMVPVPLAGLPPGDYVLTLEARTAGASARRRVPLIVVKD